MALFLVPVIFAVAYFAGMATGYCAKTDAPPTEDDFHALTVQNQDIVYTEK